MDEEALQKINQAIGSLNELIKPYQLAWVSPKHDCIILTGNENARYMTKDQQKRLTDNIAKDGFLSQLPFAIKEGDKYKIISGNHRIKAAIAANLEHVLIQYIDGVEIDKALAIQLSHNAISGQDDYSILRELYEQIGDLDLKSYTGIDEQKLFEWEALNLPTINEADIEFNEIRFLFNDLCLNRVDETVKRLTEIALDEKRDRMIFADFYRFIEIMTEIKNRAGIKNNTVAFMKMIEICDEWIANSNESQ